MPAAEEKGVAAEAELLCEAIREAGEMAQDYFRRDPQSWRKDDDTPVSEADIAIDKALRERLTGARPDIGWLSEETHDDRSRLGCERLWIVDPIDGTRAFLEGRDAWCVAGALVANGRPVAAAVSAPEREEFYHARIAGGAWLNGERLRASPRDELDGAGVIAHQSFFKAQRWDRPWPPMRRGMSTSIVLRLCLIAAGRYDAALALGWKSDWDLAAGDLLVHEAGGAVSDLAGNPLRFNRHSTRQKGLVASAPGLYHDIIERTRSLRVQEAAG